MTKQELYLTVLRGLWKQGHPSVSIAPNGKHPVCKYRGNNNDRCAVGFLIPDHKYRVAMEGMDVFDLLAEYPKLIPDMNSDKRALLGHLQNLHDKAPRLESWYGDYEKFRASFELPYGIPETTFPTLEELNAAA